MKCKELLTRNDLEKYIEWLINYLCRNEAKSIKGYICNDIMWYFHCKTKEADICQIDKLPIIYLLINEYASKHLSQGISSYYCLKYKNKMFYIGNCGDNLYFSFSSNFVPKKCDVINCEEIITSIPKK